MRRHSSFEWDPAKAGRNRHKHHVTFDLAAKILADPDGDRFHVEFLDRRKPYGEDRWVTLGSVPEDRAIILRIAWTGRGRYTRIISARKATRSERRTYEQEVFNIG